MTATDHSTDTLDSGIDTDTDTTTVKTGRSLRKPVLVEGPAGVGKTDLAVSAAKAMGQPLLRLTQRIGRPFPVGAVVVGQQAEPDRHRVGT